MSSANHPPSKGRADSTLSILNIAIGALNLANEISSITPAKAVFGSASILLTMIRVRPPLRNDGLPVQLYLGPDGERSRLCRTWALLRRCMSGSRPRIEDRTTKRAQRVHARGDRETDDVSLTRNARARRPVHRGLDVNRRTVASIQKKITKRSKRNPILRLLHVNSDKDAIVAWGRDLDRILHIFNVRPVSLVWQLLIA